MACDPPESAAPDKEPPEEAGCSAPADCDDGDSCTTDGCEDGACVSRPLLCEDPPPDVCIDEQTLRTYAPAGTCSEGACEYAPTDTICEGTCQDGGCVGVLPEGHMQWLLIIESEDMVEDPTLGALPDGDLVLSVQSRDPLVVGGTPFDLQPGGTVLTRLGPDGTVRWARALHVDDPETPYEGSMGVTGSPDGAIYVSGVHPGTIRLGPGPGEVIVPGDPDNFQGLIARLDGEGTPQWTRSTTAEGWAGVFDVAALPDGSVVASGYHDGTTVLGAGEPGETTLEASPYGWGIWVARFLADGTLAWVWDGPQGSRTLVAASGGQVFATGRFEEDFVLPNGQALQTLQHDNIFVIAFDELDGQVAWADAMSAPFAETAITATSDGAVVAGGFFGDGAGLTLSPGTPEEEVLPLQGARDLWLCRWDAAGVRQWERTGTSGPLVWARVEGLAADLEGGVQVVGYAYGDLQMEDGLGGVTTIPGVAPLGGADMVYARFDAQGVLTSANMAGGPNHDDGLGAAWGGAGPVLAGTFTELARFGRGEAAQVDVSIPSFLAVAVFGLSP
jgi:hypothetical protein